MRFCSRDIAFLDKSAIGTTGFDFPPPSTIYDGLRISKGRMEYSVRGSFVDLSIVRTWLGN